MGRVKQFESRSRSTSASLISILSKKKESSVSEFFYPELRAKYLDMATNLSFVVAIAICCGLAMAEVKKCYEVKNKDLTKPQGEVKCESGNDICQFTKTGGKKYAMGCGTKEAFKMSAKLLNAEIKDKCYKLEVPDPKKPAKMVKASQCYCEKELCNSGASDASQIKVSGAIIACLLMTLMVKT